MPTLNINGRKVQVGDEFLSLSPEDQNAAVEEIAASFDTGKLDRALDSASRTTREFWGENSKQPKEEPGLLRKIDAGVRGAADTLTFGLSDEISAGLGALTGLGGEFGDYEGNLKRQRGRDESDAEEVPLSRLTGQVAGGVGQGVGLARAGLSAGANAASAGQGLGRVAAGSMVDGALLGSAHGAGSGEDLSGRISAAGQGAIFGGALGAAAPYAVAGVSAAARPLAAPLMARVRPESYARQALSEGVARSGMVPGDIVEQMRLARNDGQDMYTLADALGTSGQRMLSTVARTPNDARQSVVDTLIARQQGQGNRLSAALAEGFGARQTADQAESALTAARSAEASRNYGAARAGAGAVDPSAAIRAADDFLQPGSSRLLQPATNIADDGVEAAVRRARGYLTDGRSLLTDFNAAHRAKLELDAMIDGARPTIQRQLIPIRNALDEALSQASPDYAMARNTFRQQSRVIDAVDTGRQSASSRMRAGDTIPQYGKLNPSERAAFRVGYADPIIGRVEAQASAPTTNKARLLQNEKFNQEFDAFSAPGRGPQLGRRIAREERMFQTANAALGGSKTADNLADAAEMARFDPGILTTLFSRGPVDAVVQAVSRVLSEGRGLPPSVIQRVAKSLMETRPDAVSKILADAMKTRSTTDGRRILANTILTALNSSATGRLAAP